MAIPLPPLDDLIAGSVVGLMVVGAIVAVVSAFRHYESVKALYVELGKRFRCEPSKDLSQGMIVRHGPTPVRVAIRRLANNAQADGVHAFVAAMAMTSRPLILVLPRGKINKSGVLRLVKMMQKFLLLDSSFGEKEFAEQNLNERFIVLSNDVSLLRELGTALRHLPTGFVSVTVGDVFRKFQPDSTVVPISIGWNGPGIDANLTSERIKAVAVFAETLHAGGLGKIVDPPLFKVNESS